VVLTNIFARLGRDALRFFQNVESVAVEEVTRSDKLSASGPLTSAIISAGLKRQ
jgi:hypothetical protein